MNKTNITTYIPFIQEYIISILPPPPIQAKGEYNFFLWEKYEEGKKKRRGKRRKKMKKGEKGGKKNIFSPNLCVTYLGEKISFWQGGEGMRFYGEYIVYTLAFKRT